MYVYTDYERWACVFRRSFIRWRMFHAQNVYGHVRHDGLSDGDDSNSERRCSHHGKDPTLLQWWCASRGKGCVARAHGGRFPRVRNSLEWMCKVRRLVPQVKIQKGGGGFFRCEVTAWEAYRYRYTSVPVHCSKKTVREFSASWAYTRVCEYLERETLGIQSCISNVSVFWYFRGSISDIYVW